MTDPPGAVASRRKPYELGKYDCRPGGAHWLRNWSSRDCWQRPDCGEVAA
jgi:hypothetical protein